MAKAKVEAKKTKSGAFNKLAGMAKAVTSKLGKAKMSKIPSSGRRKAA